MASLLRSLAKNEVLVPHLDGYFARGEFPDYIDLGIHPNKPGDDAFHPSGDCYPCAQEIYLRKTGGLPSRITGSTQKTFMVGHFWHALLQSVLIEMGFTEERYIEAKVSRHEENWWATGSADVLRCEIPGFGPALIDFKTMNDFTFKQPDIDKVLLEKWTLQTNCYLQWSGQEDIKHAIIVGVQKGTPHEFREFIIPRNESLLDDVYKKWDVVAEALRTNTIPHCECNEDRYCAAKRLAEA